jgi:hypothetical protein
VFTDEPDQRGRRQVVRDGYHEPREVVTSAGAVEVAAPQVNDKRVDTSSPCVRAGDHWKPAAFLLPPTAPVRGLYGRACRLQWPDS